MSSPLLLSADVQARIVRLFVYPIKSCAGIELSEAVLTDTGLDWDRAWMVVDASGNFLTQRDAPRMALIQPAFQRGGSELVLRAPGMLALHLSVDAVEVDAPTNVRVWDDVVPAWDMGNIAAQWFTDFLSLGEQGLPRADAPKVRLVRFDPEHRRLSSLKWTGGVEALNQFSDGYPVLVLGQSALDGLNERLQAQGHEPVDVRRFRPNVVLGELEAHDEDRVGPMQIDTPEGLVELTPVKPCPRCPMPNIDPDTARSSPEVNDTLQTYRQDARVNGGLTFGMNVIPTAGIGFTLRVGQVVRADYQF